ncbi:ATPase [Flavobacterium branchiophilum]|uniref:NadR type nicotinamide-nucleotide adenylyltransferase n=1 Tax=Flavobacterium branchiophilum TaxID=55197 RepID=A0A543G436_9FLAO|nr:DUF4301 family protein [Flavobacterium branchiophilum]OXA82233.1 ATPase [Flavobacterium branchiophilum] [Flavobacterium branchiophilum NBRC 15030 = ATCC 35035]TQM40794.1 NadR type nicotinamide-nucleotide adenylyltransferase [Flavobacterium branchiophilum]GEM55866.1 NAD metabolism ATPase/kinase [Flavobacterium branchiophilum NBRC 15030 = ATCC 35035]
MEENLKQNQSNIIKIALFGPESTGKTTLAKQLSDHFSTVWTPEFARDYLQEKWQNHQQVCQLEDMLPIAIGQTKLENDNTLKTEKLLFCDTNLMVTKVFSDLYYGFCDPYLEKAAKKHRYDLFFLTDVDVPWEKDDLRDRPTNRVETLAFFENALKQYKKPYIKLSGNKEVRLHKAVQIVNDLIKAKALGFSSLEFVQMYDHQLDIDTVANHLEIYKKGIPKTILDRPAKKNDGIWVFSEKELQDFALYFDQKKEQLQLQKFVPASGAASRMFKFLNEFLNEFDIENESVNAYINRKNATDLSVFLAGLEKFPFFESVFATLRTLHPDFMTWERDKKILFFIRYLIDTDKLDYANKPKGILPFHKYHNLLVSPIEEHLAETIAYANANGVSKVHFTISEHHQDAFEKIIANAKSHFENEGKTTIEATFSYQNTASDTLSVTLDNEPFRESKNKLLFRPGGHGALIENLGQLDADVIFIKNIDNVIQNRTEAIASYKKALAGIMLDLQKNIFSYLHWIDQQQEDEAILQEILHFCKINLNIKSFDDFDKFTFENKLVYLHEILNRPIRICGIVKNEGEPGGGPFWVRDKKGRVSLQIVESSQVDLKVASQLKIMQNATHFNPVDLVCGIKNYQHQKFDLTQFIDFETGFIVEKNKNGIELKSYELPGLWNGAMAHWITIFVQVPLITFNPVKTVNDLLKPAHQPQSI